MRERYDFKKGVEDLSITHPVVSGVDVNLSLSALQGLSGDDDFTDEELSTRYYPLKRDGTRSKSFSSYKVLSHRELVTNPADRCVWVDDACTERALFVNHRMYVTDTTLKLPSFLADGVYSSEMSSNELRFFLKLVEHVYSQVDRDIFENHVFDIMRFSEVLGIHHLTLDRFLKNFLTMTVTVKYRCAMTGHWEERVIPLLEHGQTRHVRPKLYNRVNENYAIVRGLGYKLYDDVGYRQSEFRFSRDLIPFLYRPRSYSCVNLRVLSSLKTRPAICLYTAMGSVINRDVKRFVLTTRELRTLMGMQNKYPRDEDFYFHAVHGALREINGVSPWFVYGYESKRAKDGSIDEVTFYARKSSCETDKIVALYPKMLTHIIRKNDMFSKIRYLLTNLDRERCLDDHVHPIKMSPMYRDLCAAFTGDVSLFTHYWVETYGRDARTGVWLYDERTMAHGFYAWMLAYMKTTECRSHTGKVESYRIQYSTLPFPELKEDILSQSISALQSGLVSLEDTVSKDMEVIRRLKRYRGHTVSIKPVCRSIFLDADVHSDTHNRRDILLYQQAFWMDYDVMDWDDARVMLARRLLDGVCETSSRYVNMDNKAVLEVSFPTVRVLDMTALEPTEDNIIVWDINKYSKREDASLEASIVLSRMRSLGYSYGTETSNDSDTGEKKVVRVSRYDGYENEFSFPLSRACPLDILQGRSMFYIQANTDKSIGLVERLFAKVLHKTLNPVQQMLEDLGFLSLVAPVPSNIKGTTLSLSRGMRFVTS